MTNIERFQNLQVELVRAGFETELQARPDGDEAVLVMAVELREQTAADMEKLDRLTGHHGFSYTVGDESRASVSLATAER